MSHTSQKLFQLIVPALKRGLLVKVYTCHPDLLSTTDAVIVNDLEERLADEILSRLGAHCPGTVELRYFHYTPTFRAALIGKAVLGLQTYTIRATATRAITAGSTDSERRAGEPLAPSELRLIVTRHSEHFDSLAEMTDRFLKGARAEAEPYAVLGNRDRQS